MTFSYLVMSLKEKFKSKLYYFPPKVGGKPQVPTSGIPYKLKFFFEVYVIYIFFL